MTSPYATLDLTKTATADEIKARYRKLARENHPDIHPSPRAAERMTAINAAYAVLGDASKRREYDRAQEPPPTPKQTAEDFARAEFARQQTVIRNVGRMFHVTSSNSMNAAFNVVFGGLRPDVDPGGDDAIYERMFGHSREQDRARNGTGL